MGTSSQTNASLQSFSAGIGGTVIRRGDQDYDQARRVWNGTIDRSPAAIIRCTSTADVVAAVNFAREEGLVLAVRGGGHSAAGLAVCDDGIVIDLSGMRGVRVDADKRIAYVQGGARWHDLDAATHPHGLVVGFGDSGSVGVGGLTLGGGIGFLVRKFGLTIDSVLAAEVVTADGRHLRVDAERHPELFWAIRGGGGNFGVVTRLQFRLHDLTQFTGGFLVLPATPETITGFVAASFAAPEALSTIGNIMPCPPLPFVSPDVHGRLVIFGMLAYAGDDDSAQRALAPFRSLATPLADMVKAMPYAGMYPPEDPNYRPTAVARTMFLDDVDASLAERIFDYLSKSDAAMRVAQQRVLGGAVTRVPADATAYAPRSRRMLANVAAFYTSPEDRAVRTQWVREFAAALQPNDPAGYVGFLTDEGIERVRAAYPGATWERLTKIKAQYDPDNFFRLNQNIPPRKGELRTALNSQRR